MHHSELLARPSRYSLPLPLHNLPLKVFLYAALAAIEPPIVILQHPPLKCVPRASAPAPAVRPTHHGGHHTSIACLPNNGCASDNQGLFHRLPLPLMCAP